MAASHYFFLAFALFDANATLDSKCGLRIVRISCLTNMLLKDGDYLLDVRT